MNNISSQAIVSPKAKLGNNISINHFSVIEDDVVISDNVRIHTNVSIHNGARISNGCRIYKGSAISCDPQDLKYNGEETTLEIGENTSIREYVTISKGTLSRGKTSIGSHCLIMAYVHVAHDTIIGDNAILANSTNLGGHVEIQDWSIIGGLVGIHQFVKIGCHSFVAFGARVTQDVPPYILAGGIPLNYKGLNLVGLKRRGFKEDSIKYIKQAYNFIYGSQYNISDAMKAIKNSVPQTEEVKKILTFLETSERGIIRK